MVTWNRLGIASQHRFQRQESQRLQGVEVGVYVPDARQKEFPVEMLLDNVVTDSACQLICSLTGGSLPRGAIQLLRQLADVRKCQ
jgi:hypothetical protein